MVVIMNLWKGANPEGTRFTLPIGNIHDLELLIPEERRLCFTYQEFYLIDSRRNIINKKVTVIFFQRNKLTLKVREDRGENVFIRKRQLHW